MPLVISPNNCTGLRLLNDIYFQTQVLFCTLALFTIFLAVHRFVLRHRDFDDVRDDVDKSPRVGGWVRWWLGTDDGDTGARIPIILRDNKTEHSQVTQIN